MKTQVGRHIKRERLDSGIKVALERRLDLKNTEQKGELTAFFAQDHNLCRFLAARYADCVATVQDGFPEGDAPQDVLESHVDALQFHDESYAKRLFPTDDDVVRVLRCASTVARRFYQWLDPGDLFTLGGRQFRVTEVARERVGALTREDAKKEGTATLEEWRRRWVENLPRSAGHAGWNPEQICVRHDFEATDLVPPTQK